MDVDIKKILMQCASLEYVILRNSDDLGKYPIGKDIDILAKDPPAVIRSLMKELGNYIFKGYTVEKLIENRHAHLDLLKDGVLIVRFDIVDELTLDTAAVIKYLLDSRKNKDDILFPDKVGDVFTRLLEYFNNPAAKVKHLESVKNKIK